MGLPTGLSRERILVLVKNKKIMSICLIIVFVMQKLYVKNVIYSNDKLYFATAFIKEGAHPVGIYHMIAVTVPLFFIYIAFMGSYADICCGYGKLLIIRNIQRKYLLVREIAKIYLRTAWYVTLQIMVFGFTCDGMIHLRIESFMILAAYWMLVSGFVLFQSYMEFYMNNEKALLLSGLFTVLAVAFSGIIKNQSNFIVILMINILLWVLSAKHLEKMDIY